MSAIYRCQKPKPSGHVLLWCRRIGTHRRGVWIIGWHWKDDTFLTLGCSDDDWEILDWQELPPAPVLAMRAGQPRTSKRLTYWQRRQSIGEPAMTEPIKIEVAENWREQSSPEAQEKIKQLERELERELAHPSSEHIQDIYELTNARERINQLEQKLRESEAACAAMREALESFRPVRQQLLSKTVTTEKFDRALSTDAGKSTLDRLSALESQLASHRSVMETCASEAGMNWLSCQIELSKELQKTSNEQTGGKT